MRYEKSVLTLCMCFILLFALSPKAQAYISSSQKYNSCGGSSCNTFCTSILDCNIDWYVYTLPWVNITGIPADLLDGDDNTHVRGNPPYLYNGSTVMYFNETKLNETIEALDTYYPDTDTDTHVQATSPYLSDDATYMYFNETKLNLTITTLSDLDTNTQKEAAGAYLYNDTLYIYFNESKLNSSIEALDTDTDTHIEGQIYLYNDSLYMNLNETLLNQTIITITDARDTDTTYQAGLGLNLTGTTFNINETYFDAEYVEQNEYPNLDTDATDDITTSGGTINGNLIIFGNFTLIGEVLNATVTNQFLNGSFLPGLDNLFNIGSPIQRWANIYAANFIGALDWSNLTNVPAGLDDGDDNTHVAGDGNYLTNDSSTMYFNDTKMNSTIDIRITLGADGAVTDIWINESGDTMVGNLNMTFHNITEVDTIRANYYGSNSPIRFVDANGTEVARISTTQYPEVGDDFGDIVARTLTVDRLIITGLLNYSNTEPPDVWDADEVWINENNFTFIFNESYFNQSIQSQVFEDEYWIDETGDNVTGPIYIQDEVPLYFQNATAVNASYLVWNSTKQVLELWANGMLQQEWGNSTTIYGKATFLANAIFQNVSGNYMQIDTSVLITENLTVGEFIKGNGTYITDVCHPNGTGCGASVLYAGEPQLYIFNQTMYLNGSALNASIIGLDTNTQKSGAAPYLYNDTTDIYLNESYLNYTIDERTGIFEENVTIVVSGGTGTGVTTNCCTGVNEILQIHVYPTSPTNKYRFSANTTTSGEVIDSDRALHTGDWAVAHRGSVVIDETISYYLTNVQIDEQIRIRVRYQR